jgi:hypothetical protein
MKDPLYFLSAMAALCAPAFLALAVNPSPGEGEKDTIKQILCGVQNASESARPTEKHVWIAARTDGKAGMGTTEDPYDGSTQAKFDTIMMGASCGSIIHLGPGTFLTKGGTIGTSHGYEWVLPSVIKVVGSGINQTTIRLADKSVSAGGVAHMFRHASVGTRAEFSDFTIDCNIANQLAGTGVLVNGINGNALYSSAERVRVIHFGGDLGEGFPLVLGCYSTAQDSFHRIIDCELDYPSAVNIGISGFGIYGARSAGLIAGCYANGRSVQGFVGYSAAGGGRDIKIIGNTSVDCWGGFHLDTATDTGPVDGLQLVGNSFLGCAFSGLDIGEPSTGAGAVGRFKNIRVENNYFTLKTGTAGGAGNNPNGIWLRGDVRDSVFMNNLITVAAGYDWSPAHGGSGIQSTGASSGNTFLGNRLHNALPGFVPAAHGSRVDNFHFDGTDIFSSSAPAPALSAVPGFQLLPRP